MKKVLFFFLVISACTISASARSMKDLWSSAPDSLFRYVDHNHRLEMTSFIDMGFKGDVDNQLGSKSVMDTITNDYIHLTLSAQLSMAIKRLAVAGGDSVLCVVRTWSAPEKESSALLYDQNWNLIGEAVEHSSDLKQQLLVRPDTMSEANYRELLGEIDFTMVSYELGADKPSLKVSLSIPAVDKVQKQRFSVIKKLKELNWDSRTFN